MRRPQKIEGLEIRALDGEVLVYDRSHDKVHVLNTTASDILEMCDGSRSLADIAGVISGAKIVDRSIVARDVEAILEQFRALGLVVESQPADQTRCAPAVGRDVLARFDAEMRIDPPLEPGVVYERVAGIVRARGAQNWIVWWTIDAAGVDAAVAAQARYFRAEQQPLEWKVYAHDTPANLVAALGRHGFEPDERETLMVLDLRAQAPSPPIALPAGITLRGVDDERGLRDFVAVSSASFAYDASPLLTELPPRLFGAAPTGAAYVAYSGAQPVAAGRLECPAGRSFASIWGGSTLPGFRGRGLFRAMVAVRAEHARRVGYPLLTVDARETSRPILERLGFVALTTVTGWNLQL